jgi:hypothetical protein
MPITAAKIYGHSPDVKALSVLLSHALFRDPSAGIVKKTAVGLPQRAQGMELGKDRTSNIQQPTSNIQQNESSNVELRALKGRAKPRAGEWRMENEEWQRASHPKPHQCDIKAC